MKKSQQGAGKYVAVLRLHGPCAETKVKRAVETLRGRFVPAAAPHFGRERQLRKSDRLRVGTARVRRGTPPRGLPRQVRGGDLHPNAYASTSGCSAARAATSGS